MSRELITPFSYYGGKFSHLDSILPLLPEEDHYVEAFSGSGAILLNREPAQVETLNDLDGSIINFFRVLRESPEELLYQVEQTPHSRSEYELALEDDPDLSNLERARRFYVRVRQSRNGEPDPSPGQWSYNRKHTARGISKATNRYYSRIQDLFEVADRLKEVQIENLPAIDVIERYDTPDTLHYLDPPYVHESREHTRGYVHEMTADDHRELAEVIMDCEGKVAVSGYNSSLYRELFSDWYHTTLGEKSLSSSPGEGSSRTEVLWTNYDTSKVRPNNQTGLSKYGGEL